MNNIGSKHWSTVLYKVVSFIVIVIALLMVFLPILWMISTSFKTEPETITIPPTWIPKNFSLKAYSNFFTEYDFLNQLKNSLIYVIGSTLITVICACLAGYGCTRFKFKGKGLLMSFIMMTQMIPSIILLVPFYKVLNAYGLLNTYTGMILVYAALNISFSTWMMLGFFKSIPTDLDEAARIDGASNWQTFWKVVLPITLPGIATVIIYSFIQGWNEYMFASVLTNVDTMKTITVGIAQLNGEYKVLWNDLMAASVIASLPLILLYLFTQKMFVAGMTSGAVKG